MNIAHLLPREVDTEARPAEVTLESFCTPEMVDSLSFETAFEMYPRYRHIITKKGTLIKTASEQDANVTLAFNKGNEVVGLGILRYPSPDERWTEVGPQVMMEISIIEISRPWRGVGLSKKILERLMVHPLKEKRIIYMVGYSWTWDLVGKGMTPMGYRNMLIQMFSRNGLQVFQTNEPNILLRTENVFMARIGACISEETKKRFKWVRFNLDLSLLKQ